MKLKEAGEQTPKDKLTYNFSRKWIQIMALEGSRKHILGMVNSPEYLATLNRLLQGCAAVTDQDAHEPVGGGDVAEAEIPGFCRRYCSGWFDIKQLEGWWLPDQPTAGRPRGATWDLLSTCTIGGRPGLLLVEGKAHENELSFAGKSLSSNASDQSRLNHQHITDCLSSVASKLKENDLTVSIGVESHYQLANRIAWAWKMADCGVPIVLLYLGFLGDTYFPTDNFKNADHYQRAMGAYLYGIIPTDLPRRSIEGRNGGSFTMLVESTQLSAQGDLHA